MNSANGVEQLPRLQFPLSKRIRRDSIKLNLRTNDRMATMVYEESQEKLENLIRTMIASGMITEIPRIEYSMIELSVFKRIKPPAITAKCLACLAGNHP